MLDNSKKLATEIRNNIIYCPILCDQELTKELMWTYSMIFVRVGNITCSLSIIGINFRVRPEIQQGAYNSTMTTACRKWQSLRNTLEHNFDIYIQLN